MTDVLRGAAFNTGERKGLPADFGYSENNPEVQPPRVNARTVGCGPKLAAPSRSFATWPLRFVHERTSIHASLDSLSLTVAALCARISEYGLAVDRKSSDSILVVPCRASWQRQNLKAGVICGGHNVRGLLLITDPSAHARARLDQRLIQLPDPARAAHDDARVPAIRAEAGD
jgi:hypothetical protein